MKSFLFSVLLLLSGFFNCTFAQNSQFVIEEDSIEEEKRALYGEVKEYDPNRAALLSAALPGLGQIYTKKYWKLPLVYGGAVGFVMYYQFANKEYLRYKGQYQSLTSGSNSQTTQVIAPGSIVPTTTNSLDPKVNAAYQGQRYYRRNRDLTIIMGAVFYSIVIVDAYVDAHLKAFEVTDKLSMTVRPAVSSYAYHPNLGLKLNLNIR